MPALIVSQGGIVGWSATNAAIFAALTVPQQQGITDGLLVPTNAGLLRTGGQA